MSRPPKPEGEKYRTPQRQLGRVNDEDWQTLKAAAENAGVPFTQWALPILMRNAKREKRATATLRDCDAKSESK